MDFNPSVLTVPPNQELLMYPAKKRSAAAISPSGLYRGQRLGQIGHFGQLLDAEGVVHPPALAAVDDQAGLLQNSKMKGEPGLCGIERIGELAHAAFAPPQAVENGEPGLVRQGMEEAGGSVSIQRYGSSHGTNYINDY
jgi:hypothetical protein